ncbi:LPXTG cell wall anchor domain-containing protein, partial [Streptomyces sp. SID10115]
GGTAQSGATGTDMAIGGALVAAALLGGGVFWMRRRSENRI